MINNMSVGMKTLSSVVIVLSPSFDKMIFLSDDEFVKFSQYQKLSKESTLVNVFWGQIKHA